MIMSRQRVPVVMADSSSFESELDADAEYLEGLERQLRRKQPQPAALLPRGSSTLRQGRKRYDYLLREQTVLLSALSLLFGFWSFINTMEYHGAAGFWEPIGALVPLVVTERISEEYYSRSRRDRSPTLKVCRCKRASWAHDSRSA